MEEQVIQVPVLTETLTPGLTLRHKLRGHQNIIYEIAWSPDGRTLASVSADRSIRLWGTQHGQLLHEPIGHRDYVYCVAWSPDSRLMACGSHDETIRLLDGATGKRVRDLFGHRGPVYSVAWSPDGRYLASASYDKTIRIWDSHNRWSSQALIGHEDWVMSIAWSPDGRTLASGSRDRRICFWDVSLSKLFRKLKGHHNIVNSVTWSADGRYLASASDDQTIRLWDTSSGRLLTVLEGHTGLVLCVRFSPDGSLLASKSQDGSVWLWRCDTWEQVAKLDEPMKSDFSGGLAFHPDAPMLATLGPGERAIRIWQLDEMALLGPNTTTETWQYRNAKVVLVGDTGVGKSGLGLVMTGHPWVHTGSSHGCRVWTFDNRDVSLPDGRQETRETLLWDLAGQPGYRLTNQLHLNEVSVALVVFDASYEDRPMAGVEHWDRALRQALRRQGDTALPMTKFLVAARIDRGGVPIWHSRMQHIVREMGFDGYFETSAKEDWQIDELVTAIQEAIDWDPLPRVSSNELFQTIKRFLLDEKREGHVLSTTDDLFRLFCQAHSDLSAVDLRARFETCLSRMENRALVRRLRFGSYILLQPELLDAFASDLVDAAQQAPDGLATVAEEDALHGRLVSARHEHLVEKEQQRMLLIATVEELIRHEIVLKEPSEAGTNLIFPSQFTRRRPDLKTVAGKTIQFTFEGPVLNVYAVLTVRLAHSQLFNKKEMWKNAATFTAKVGGTCGLYLCDLDGGRGELTLFFDEAASETTRYQFEDYVDVHLQRRALPGTIQRRRLFVCRSCGVPITEAQVQARRQRGHSSLTCPVCEAPVSLLDREERLAEPVSSTVAAIDQAADAQRERAVAELVLRGKQTTNDYDVFLCHHPLDETAVKEIAVQLQERGILPWLPMIDQPVNEQDIMQMRAIAVCVGVGRAPWHNSEIVKLLQRFLGQGKGRFILIALPGCPENMQFPEGVMCVNWREQNTEAMDLLASLIISKPKYELLNK